MGECIGELIGYLSEVDQLIGELSSDEEEIIGEMTIPDVIHVDEYDGDYEVIPQAHDEVILPTNGLVMKDDVTVREVPYYEVSNEYGYTVYIASNI